VAGKAYFLTPALEERNFAVADKTLNHVTVESDDKAIALEAVHGAVAAAFAGGSSNNFKSAFKVESLERNLPLVSLVPDHADQAGGIRPVVLAECALDEFGNAPYHADATIARRPIAAPEQVIFVVDGSVWMKPYLNGIQNALRGFANQQATVVFVTDHPAAMSVADFAKRAKPDDCAGGQEDSGALRWSVEKLVSTNRTGTIVWIHGPQPLQAASGMTVGLSGINWNGTRTIYDYQCAPGCTKTWDQTEWAHLIGTVPFIYGPESDLNSLFESWKRGEQLQLGFQLHYAESTELPVAAGPRDIAQLAAASELANGIAANSYRANLLWLATTYHIVTPLSSAVVVPDKPIEATAVPPPPPDPLDQLLATFQPLFPMAQSQARQTVDICFVDKDSLQRERAIESKPISRDIADYRRAEMMSDAPLAVCRQRYEGSAALSSCRAGTGSGAGAGGSIGGYDALNKKEAPLRSKSDSDKGWHSAPKQLAVADEKHKVAGRNYAIAPSFPQPGSRLDSELQQKTQGNYGMSQEYNEESGATGGSTAMFESGAPGEAMLNAPIGSSVEDSEAIYYDDQPVDNVLLRVFTWFFACVAMPILLLYLGAKNYAAYQKSALNKPSWFKPTDPSPAARLVR
jgi:hypothetical protein